MTAVSLDRLLVGSRLGHAATASVHAQPNTLEPDYRLEGQVKSGRANAREKGAFSRRLDARAPMLRNPWRAAFGDDAMPFDARQRVVVKMHYFNHAGGGGGALKAHARYVARDAVGRDDLEGAAPLEARSRDAEADRERAHADYLSRGRRDASSFYDASGDGVDGAACAADWAMRDKRHFRVIIAPENLKGGRGERLADLPAFTREVMARAEAELGSRLQWVAVDHHNTDNPHTHLILRGRRGTGRFGGQDLVLPKDFVRHGLRDIARDVATDTLGRRSPADERLALEAEITRHAPTRLDRMIARQLPEDGRVRVAKMKAPNGDPALSQAVKARAKELVRLGLATETKGPGIGHKVLALEADWQDRLRAMELHINVRKRLMVERTAQRQVELERAILRR